MNVKEYKTIDEYVAAQPASIKEQLQTIRDTVHAAAPQATEAISYAMPTFRVNGKNMLHFAAFSRHIGFYATPDGHAEFEQELSKYRRGKGSVQFPIDEPLPLDLIRRIAEFRATQLSKGER
jgi:uncharacterized protein YdhG (YjbR/CyaY superfamily)